MPALPETRAEQVVVRALRQAFAKMERAAVAAMAQGPVPQDQLWLIAQTTKELERIAEEFAADVTSGEWGKMIKESAEKGLGGIEGSILSISKEEIEVALHNAQVHIKDIAAEGVKKVNEIITTGIIRGDSQKLLTRLIQRGLRINNIPVALARARMIARSELFSAYRQGALLSTKESGFKYFQMNGPQPGDSRISKICARYVNKVKTKAEWEKIHPYALIYGLHYQCRHTFDAVETREGIR